MNICTVRGQGEMCSMTMWRICRNVALPTSGSAKGPPRILYVTDGQPAFCPKCGKPIDPQLRG